MMPGAQHRPGAGPHRPDETRCENGHNIETADSLDANGRCRECRLAQRSRARQRAAAAGPRLYCNCVKCGARKFEDSRALCLSCRAGLARDKGASAGAIDAMLDDAVLMESAPLYIKRDKREHASWLAWKRRELTKPPVA